jgi:hypothetical protein
MAFCKRLDPARVVGDEIDNRPVAAEDEAVGAEDVEDRLEIWLQPRRRPVRAVFGEDARNLAMHMFQVAEALHVAPPRLEGAIGDFGLGHVVDDDGQVRIALDELDGVEDMPRLDQRVEAQAEILDRPDGRVELRLEDPVILRQVLKIGADALQLPEPRPAGKIGNGRRGKQVHPGNDALDEIMAVCHAQQIAVSCTDEAAETRTTPSTSFFAIKGSASRGP